MKRIHRHFLYILAIGIIIVLYFFRMFYPESHLILTQDFGRSDIWHFMFPVRVYYWQQAQNASLPIWTDTLGSGFPLLAEGEIGAFFPINSILTLLFDAVAAYNLSIVTTFIIMAVGMYVWMIQLGFRPLISFFGSITLVFSGYPYVQIPHLTFIQGFSMLPWVLAALTYMMNTPTIRSALLLGIAGGIQLLSGFPQGVLITAVCAGIFIIWSFPKVLRKIYVGGLLLLAASIACGLSAIQLLPSYEFLTQISSSAGFSHDGATAFSFPPRHLTSFIRPFWNGNPADGTYPPFYVNSGSIFWENTMYLGLLPLLALCMLFAIRKKLAGRQRALLMYILPMAGVAFFLMLGKFSPFHFIYAFWPFRLFRVPSRFLFPLGIMIILAASITYEWIVKYKNPRIYWTLVSFLVANTLYIMLMWWNYHPYVEPDRWLQAPESIQYVAESGHVLTIDTGRVHNEYFLADGWQQMDSYAFLRNTLAPSSNLLWNVSQFRVNAGRTLKRQDLVDSLFEEHIKRDGDHVIISKTGYMLLFLYRIHTIISPSEIVGETLDLKQIIVYGENSLYIYQTQAISPYAYVAYDHINVSTLEDVQHALSTDEFSPEESILIESTTPSSKAALPFLEVSATREKNTTTIQVIDNPQTGELVLDQTYYPGWEATLDGGDVPLFPVNIKMTGLTIPQGTHTIQVFYRPKSLFYGAGITISTIILTMALALFDTPFFAHRRRP